MSKPSIAIIGTGISGLGAAYLLHRDYTVTVYEKNDRIGGHTRTLEVSDGERNIPVDTGFIVFNRENYPNLTKLFEHLNVAVQKSDMTFGITLGKGALEWGASNLNALFGQRSNLLRLSFWHMLLDIAKFNRHASAVTDRNPDMVLGDLLDQLGMGKAFRDHYLLPMAGAIWSCPPEQMLAFPATAFIRFFKNHGLLTIRNQPQWYTVTGGAREYVAKLIVPFQENILISRAVLQVKRQSDGVLVTDSTNETRRFDRVIFACHADQALALLTHANETEKSVLGAFRYQQNLAVLHQDPVVMPRRKRCWSSWVYQSATGGADNTRIGVTYWMNLLQSFSSKLPIFVTLNTVDAVAPGKILDRHVFEHPVFTQAAIDAQARLEEIQGANATWYCGAWQRNGFHEDGLSSAVAVAQKMGVGVPWR